MEKHLIYKHTFPNNKVYIGQCVGETIKEAERRWGKDGYNYKTQFVYRAIKKYGWNNVQHEILEIVDSQEDADKQEIYYIALYDSTNKLKGYNIQFGGGGNNMGKNCHQIGYQKKLYWKNHEHKLELSRKHYWKNREKNIQYKRDRRKAGDDYGRIYNEQHKEKRHDYDRIYNEQHKEKRHDYNRVYHEQHKEEKSQYMRQWYLKFVEEHGMTPRAWKNKNRV